MACTKELCERWRAKFPSWSDHHGNLESSFTKDDLLTNIMIHWVTQTMPSSTRMERNHGGTLFHWTEMPRSGHFAALEQPELLAEDARLFFRKVKTQK